MIRKITEGWVEQVFDDFGNCLGQAFHAGDTIDIQFGDGPSVDYNEGMGYYHPFVMVQPDIRIVVKRSDFNIVPGYRACVKIGLVTVWGSVTTVKRGDAILLLEMELNNRGYKIEN